MTDMSNWREEPVMSIPEVAKVLKIGKSLAYRLVANSQLPAIRLGEKRLVVPTQAVIRILEEAK